MSTKAQMPPRPLLGRVALGVALAGLWAFGGCIHQKPKAEVSALRDSTETFHKLARWGDVKAAARFVAPEQRLDFLREVINRNDEDNLKITDYELEDAQIGPDAATILSKISWHRLPSVTTTTEAMALIWEDRDGVWVIAAIEGGPFPMEARPKPPPPPPAR